MDWFEKAFNKDYIEVYAHRTEEQAKSEIAFAHQHLNFNKQHVVLDLCCGAGRHAFNLSPLVKTVVGFDLSTDLLSIATQENLKKKYNNIFWQNGDMRELNYHNSFDAVVSFFNSFGYFANENENLEIMGKIYRALKPRGFVLMDLMNKSFVIKNLIPQSEKKIKNILVKEFRHISSDGLRVEKKVVIFKAKKMINEYQESVRMYSKDEIQKIFKKFGFKSIQIFGNINSEPLSENSSRLMILGKKN